MGKNNKKSGWREDADPTCINKKGKPVARRHHEVTVRKEVKNEYGSTLRTPLPAPLKHEDREEAEELSEEIVEEVQDERTDSAKAKDESKTAKKVGSKEDAEDLVEWIKEPGKSDLEDVDTKSNKSKKHEAEEE